MQKNKQNKKLSKVKDYGSLPMTQFEGSIERCIDILQEIKEKGCTHVKFNYYEPECCSSYDHSLEFSGIYLETDSEYEERINELKNREKAKREKYKQQRIKQKEERKSLYEKLKKEFDK